MSRGKKNKKKEPRRRQDVEKRKEDKSEEIHRGQPTPTHAEKLAHYFKSDELVELRNMVQSSDLSNVPLLLAAVMLGKFDVVKRLFKEGAPIDTQGPEQTTPLMWAVKHKNMEMIDLLIRRGAKITLEDIRGDNAILLALQTPAWDQDSFLDFWNSVKECETFDLNHANKTGYTMLHYATKNQWENVLNYLLSQGVNVNCVTSKGVTPLMMAASRNHSQFVRALLRARADVSIEDERCCTALCYTIAFVIQKHLELPNPTLEGLMNTIENCKSNFSLEMYLKRRLDVLLKPPETGSNFADIISGIMHSIIVFFVRCTKTGLELLLEQQVFSRLFEATEAHLDDPDYTHALLGLMLELLRYCPCCYGGGTCPISEDEIMDIFVASGGANICLSILKIYNNVVSNKWLLVAALMPLFSACPTKGSARTWLEAHYKEILPYYNNFLDMCLVKFNINADEYHLSLLSKKTKDFRKLMNKLERGESIVTREESKSTSENSEQEQSITEQEHSLTQINSVMEVEIVPDHSTPVKAIKEQMHFDNEQTNSTNGDVISSSAAEDFVADQETVLSELENSMIEHENSVIEHENSIIEEENSINEQENSIIEQENSIIEQDISNNEQDQSVSEQEIFYFDTNGNFCSISCTQNVTVSGTSLDKISQQESMNAQCGNTSSKILPEMPKIWETEQSKMKNTEIAILNDDHKELEETNICPSPDFIPLHHLENESSSLSFSDNIQNRKYNGKFIDVLEEGGVLNSSYFTKMGSVDDKHTNCNVNLKKIEFVKDVSNLYLSAKNLNDVAIIDSADTEETADDFFINKRSVKERKEIPVFLKDFDSEDDRSISSQQETNKVLPNIFQAKSCILISSQEKKSSEFLENQILQSLTSDSEEEKCKGAESIPALDDLFKKLLVKYVKSWQYEHDHNYPGHCGGGDGFNVDQRMNENFLKLKPFLSKLEKDYIIYLKSIWESFKEKLKETQNLDLYKDIASQVIELIRRHDKKLDAKMKRIDEILQKQMQSENDYSMTISGVDSKETLSSICGAHSTAGSDTLSDETKNFMKKFDVDDDDEYSFHHNTLDDINFPLSADDNLDDSMVQCWESVSQNGDIIYNRQNFDLPSVSVHNNSKLIEHSNNRIINSKPEVILYDDSSDISDNLKVIDVFNSNSEMKESARSSGERKIQDIINCQPIMSIKSNEESHSKKLSFAELFKDHSGSHVTAPRDTIFNSIVTSDHSSQLSQGVPTAFASVSSNDVGANAVSHHIQYVPPPPGFPAHPLLSLESLLRIQAEVNNCHALQPPLPVYMNLPEAMLCPEKVAIFMSGRSMGASSSPTDITQVAPLVMIPGLPNYTSRWKFLISILQNIPPMYSHWCLDGIGMKRIALFDGPMKLPGGGNFGEVFFGLGDSKLPLAAKVLYMNPTNASSTVGMLLQRMITPLMKLKHEHLLSYIYCGHHECRLFLISPLCECNLGEYLMCLKVHNKLEYRSSELVKQLALGVNFLHTLPDPIIHGNLKPSNILLDDQGTIKLADFGLHPILYQINGAPSSSIIWWARETHDAFKHSNHLFCTFKSDIQVTGMMIHFIMTGGLHPFGAEAFEIIESVCKGNTKLKTSSCEVNDLISWMMVFEPKNRPSISDIMNHVFFWDQARKWKFVLGCCGIDNIGQALPLPVAEFHSTLDLKAVEDNVKGDWVSIVKTAFPDVSVDNSSSDTPTGLLKFIRICVEEQKEKKLVNSPQNLQSFFLSAFPALTLSLFRLVEETEWRKHPVIANLLKGN